MEYSNRTADTRQEKKFERTIAACSVNALSIVLGISWEEAFKFLLRAAHQLHLMPAESRGAEDMLWESGWVLLPEEIGCIVIEIVDIRSQYVHFSLSSILTRSHPRLDSAQTRCS